MRAWLCLVLVGCGWGGSPQGAPSEASSSGGTPRVVPQRVGAGRKVAVTLGKDAIQPARIEANPNEALTLVLEREGPGCADEVVFPSTGARTRVPTDDVVEVGVAAPASGELGFTCGALSGVIVVPGS